MMKKSILLVDDSPHNLKLTRFLLMEEGFDVGTAENAEQALRALETRMPDMILMDIHLPGMDGLALTRHLRRDGSLHNVPIVAFTAAAIKGDEALARAAGCDGYITKPIDTRTFISTVREYVGCQTSRVLEAAGLSSTRILRDISARSRSMRRELCPDGNRGTRIRVLPDREKEIRGAALCRGIVAKSGSGGRGGVEFDWTGLLSGLGVNGLRGFIRCKLRLDG